MHQTTARMFRYKHIAKRCSFLSGIKNKKLINNDFSHIQHQAIATNNNPSSLVSIFFFDHTIQQIHYLRTRMLGRLYRIDNGIE